MFAATNGCAILGTEAVPVRVEASVERGLPRFTIVGMREAEAREARERIRCALLAVDVPLPLQRVTVNLAPADLPKAGAAFDLPIIAALLACVGKVPPPRVERMGAHAEVSLDARLRPVSGTMAAALTAARFGWSEFLVEDSVSPLAAHASLPVTGITNLGDLISHLQGRGGARAHPQQALAHDATPTPELSEVRGQERAVLAARVAAAGGHNMLMFGPPGCGKTMLATRIPSLLPELCGDAALEVATIHDAAGLGHRLSGAPPFRAPHHTISAQALVGGGSSRPIIGELTLAHRGVLFLDELPEFRPSALESLRQPLEQRAVTIRRARWLVRYPADVQLVAAMNLCRCGRAGSSRGAPCSCSHAALDAYQRRVSGAIRDRFDLKVGMDLPGGALSRLAVAPRSAQVREAAIAARERQRARWGDGALNAHQRSSSPRHYRVDPDAQRLLARVVEQRAMSGRSQAATLRVARTLADLDDVSEVAARHMAVALDLDVREERHASD